jgi:hypothetical protein
MLDKATEWLRRLSADDAVDSLLIVGKMIEPVMERERPHQWFEQIQRALAEQNLTYLGEGRTPDFSNCSTPSPRRRPLPRSTQTAPPWPGTGAGLCPV